MSLLYALSAYSKGASVLPAFILSGRQFSVHRGKFSAKQGKSEFFFGVLWCFLGIFGDNKRQNLRYIWILRVLVIGSCGSSCFRAVFPAFCPLVCFVLVVSLTNMALFRILRGFLEGFMVRMYICMGLGFCVDCGAFVCVSG